MSKTYSKAKFFYFLVLFLAFIVPQPLFAQTADPNLGVADKVRASFPDMPDMVPIAQCESGTRQFRSDGSVLKGGTGGHYVGIFQIDENLHTAKALGMGFDINTVDGNIAYARYMFFGSGTAPWKGCLSGNPVTPAPVPTIIGPTPAPAPSPVTGQLSVNLNYGMVSPQVLILQQILNRLGFTLALSGPGSAGNETTRFGDLTREAVRKFQCAKAITCDGNESTTGYGRVGPRTRSVLNSL